MTWKRDADMERKLQATFAQRGYPAELIAAMQYWASDEGLVAFVGREYCGGREKDPLRWHISVRGEGTTPTWAQLAEAAHAIRPGVHFVLMVPPKSLWMNVHEDVLHLWETDDPALVNEARTNAAGHTPT